MMRIVKIIDLFTSQIQPQNGEWQNYYFSIKVFSRFIKKTFIKGKNN
jgi:hypothetical protein